MSQPGVYDVRLRPELLDDVAVAFAWYEDRAEGLGREFARTFYATVVSVARQPTVARMVYTEFRRVRLRRVPYSLYYRIDGSDVVFFLLFHFARDPKHLRDALRQRGSL